MPDIICLGEVIVDLVAMDRDTGLKDTRGFFKFPGGATANVAVGISRLGGKSGFLGAVSDDPFGEFLRKSLDDEGVDTSRMRSRHGEHTVFGFIGVKSDQSKEVIFYRQPHAEMFLSPGELDPEYFDGARIFHFGIICLRTDQKFETTMKCLEFARNRNLPVSLDTNYRPHAWPSAAFALERLRKILPMVTVFKIAEEEWPLLFGGEPDDQEIRDILETGVRVVIISRGPRGATVITPSYRETIPGFAIPAAETTGAGDAFTACCLERLAGFDNPGSGIQQLEPGGWREIIRKANAAGALTCMKPGAIPALPTKSELDRFLESKSRE